MSLFLAGCDHGLAPPSENQRTAISGTITYQNWPPADSLKDLRLVAFKEYPPVGESYPGRYLNAFFR